MQSVWEAILATAKFYGHPFSSYTQKALIAFYEKEEPFEFELLEPSNPTAGETLKACWPLGKFPLVIADGRNWFEASVVVEWVDQRSSRGPRLIPTDPTAALDVRMRDRIFDNYVMDPMQRIVADRLRPETDRDPYGVESYRSALDRIYDWLDGEMASREWAAGDDFTMADCAAAPSLFYANWVRPFAGRPNLETYFARLYARPSFARAVDEARPYRHYFPGGAPTDRG